MKKTLEETGDRNTKPIVQALKDKNNNVKQYAGEILVGIGKPAVEPLIEALSDDDAYTSSTAAWALGNIGDKRAIKPLIQNLSAENEETKLSCARALVEIGEPAVPDMIKSLENQNKTVRKYIVFSLIEMGDKRAVPELKELFKEKNRNFY
ncbi:HEAT repeat domain-containing protein [Methanosarcina barkeri]|uniref:HEAT repeat domain-containing protein n=1 Tax=Methanosarcina barkeri TaxID=2208 RepID=UPI00311DFA7D